MTTEILLLPSLSSATTKSPQQQSSIQSPIHSKSKSLNHHHHQNQHHVSNNVNNDDDATSSDSTTTSSASSSTSDRYKTELCRSFEETRACRYGAKCQFAHGVRELREMPRHPKYKTELCKNFHARGSCPYGPRCRFIHDELDFDRQLIASLGAARVSELRRMLQSPALLQSPAISPVTSPRLSRRSKSNPISPVRNNYAAPVPPPYYVHVPIVVASPTINAVAPAPAAPAVAVAAAAAAPVTSSTTTAAAAAVAVTSAAAAAPAAAPVPMAFQLFSNVHTSASSSTASDDDEYGNDDDDGSDSSVDPAAIAAAALAEPEPARNVNGVMRSAPRLVPTRLFVDRTEPVVVSPTGKSPTSSFGAIGSGKPAKLSEKDSNDIDQLVAELAHSLESDTPGQWAKREKKRSAARLPIFSKLDEQ